MKNFAKIFRKDILLIFLEAFLLSIIIFYGINIIKHEYYQSDFVSFFSSAQIMHSFPNELYNFSLQKSYQLNLIPNFYLNLPGIHFFPYINPPFFLLPYLFLLNFPPQQAYQVIMLSVIMVMGLCIWALMKIFPLGKKKGLFIVVLILAYAPTYTTIYLTQSSYTTLLVFIATYYLLREKHWFLAGLVASFMLYKPQLGIILYIYLILLRNKHIIIGLTLGSIFLFVFSWILAQGNIFSLLYSLPEFTQQIGAGPKLRITWLGFFHQLSDFIPQLPYQLLTYLFSFATVIWGLKTIYKIKPSSKYFPFAYSIIIIITLLDTIHVHYQETALLLFPLFYFMKNYPSTSLYLIIILGWITYLLSIFNPFFPKPLLFLPTLFLVVILFISFRDLSAKR